ncbi:MAG: hypothetical protein DRI88_11705 [Bacteroidetes bacterium]|nr:MAG: hypothetical protein DRI88_11705 [Bacteroidota bacterium]RLD71424.1 MAG: hypothetical protein DRI87_06960 [Bacteroidota bacterium]RLD88591.1 MAG: hypothetical protein DRJ02_03570 [Bacteroidota bacterium]
MGKIYFTEEQRFSNFWLYVFVIIVFTIAIAPTATALYSQIILGIPYGEEPSSDEALLVLLVILLVMFVFTLLLFHKMKMVTEVRNDGVFYRYPPFILKFKQIRKEEIEKYKVRKYSPIKEYSGWGIRYSWGKSGRAYNVKGNIGLQLYLVDGKKILLGTQRGDALQRAMDKMMVKETNG